MKNAPIKQQSSSVPLIDAWTAYVGTKVGQPLLTINFVLGATNCGDL